MERSGIEESWHFVHCKGKLSAKILRLAALAQDDSLFHEITLDAHIGLFKSYGFAENNSKLTIYCRGDVGIAPYEYEKDRSLTIRVWVRKHPMFLR